jgi:hypothetical protein
MIRRDYIKNSKKINNFIPLIVMLLGIGANIWAVGAITLETCVAGAVSGLASTGLYEAFSNIIGLAVDDKLENAKHAAEEVDEKEEE